jgi:hypothetical protein
MVSQMSTFKQFTIAGSSDWPVHVPLVMIKQFENGMVQIYQANRYNSRAGKTIHLTPEMFVCFRAMIGGLNCD